MIHIMDFSYMWVILKQIMFIKTNKHPGALYEAASTISVEMNAEVYPVFNIHACVLDAPKRVMSRYVIAKPDTIVYIKEHTKDIYYFIELHHDIYSGFLVREKDLILTIDDAHIMDFL